jgi:hypothetical protein
MVRESDIKKEEEEDTSMAVALLDSEPNIKKVENTCSPLEVSKPPDFDISDVIAIRLKAMRQLSENPNSDEAKKHLEDATQMVYKNTNIHNS